MTITTTTATHPDAPTGLRWVSQPYGHSLKTTIAVRGEAHTVYWITDRREYQAYGVPHATWPQLIAWLRSLPDD